MVRSASCFKILTCRGDGVGNDDFEALESKGSSDGCGWSFRKRSARHRVLNNTVSSETPSYGNKESPDSATIQTVTNSVVTEKASVLQWPGEKPRLSTSVDSKEAEPKVAAVVQLQVSVESEESIVIVIQTAIRGILSQTKFQNLKSLVKLQAAVRGHLVRRHAVGTLRCVRAIIKMQSLFRARRSRLISEGASMHEKLVGDYKKPSRPLGNSKSTNATIEKFLSNRFASQLLESAPKARPIHIKCDPSTSGPSSAWTWLERWMSVSSSRLADREKQEANFDHEDSKSEEFAALVPLEETRERKPCFNEPAALSTSKESSITYDEEETFEFQAGHHNMDNSNVKESPAERDSLVYGSKQSYGSSPESAKPAVGNESANSLASEAPENEGNQAVSKSEASSLMVNLDGSMNLSCQDAEDVTNLEAVSHAADALNGKRALTLVENLATQNLRSQIGGSECGTELSVTSTLDSLEISDDHGSKVSNNPAIGSRGLPINSEFDSPKMLTVQPAENDEANVRVSMAELVLEMGHGMDRASSPDASPRSHTTVPESQGTPLSQVSTNATQKEAKKSRPINKNKSKKSPPYLSHDLGATSGEQIPKDQKSGKRRSSFSFGSSAKTDVVEAEPRDSGSHSSLPSYMQPTESALAKAQLNNSPRSSPDVDKESCVKKRHSLPVANGRQGSPRILRSMSQAPQSTKGSSSQSPHARKWQR